MTTLRRELRTKIKQILEENGIYTDAIPPMPSIVDILADGVLGVAGISRAYANAQMMGQRSRDTTKERQMLAERIEAQLHVTPDQTKKVWVTVLNRIIEKEEKGETLEKYVKWYNDDANKYDRPTISQILKNPALLIGSWPKAMAYSGMNETQSRML